MTGPEVGRLDRVLAAAKVAHEPGGDPALLSSALNGCWTGDGCLGQHRLDQHPGIEEAVGEPLSGRQVDAVVAAVTLPLATYRGMAAALEAECALLAEALGHPEVTHEFLPAASGRWCGNLDPAGRYCDLPEAQPVHRTPARVRAELERP